MSRVNQIEIEQQFVGGLFLMSIREMAPSDILQSCSGLSVSDFYNQPCGVAFGIVKKRCERGLSFDVPLIISESSGKIDSRYLFEIVNAVASTANMGEYRRLIKQSSLRREGMALGNTISDMLSKSDDPAVTLGQAESMIQTLMGKAHFGKSDFIHLSELFGQYIDEVDQRLKGTGQEKVLLTGIDTIDQQLDGGILPGSLIVMGGRPASGKTSLMLSFLRGMARAMGGREALAFSLEMSNLQLAKRYASFYTGKSYNAMIEDMQRDPDGTMFSKISAMIGQDQDLPIYLSDSRNLSIEKLCADVRTRAKESDVGVICVDYLGLMDLPKADRHDLSIGTITRSLKILAGELDCVVLLLAQVNRGVEQRANKRPMPSDFRDSGSIEQDADYIFTIYRESVYNPDTPMGSIGEIICGKSRHSHTFTTYMDFVNGSWIDGVDQASAYNRSTEEQQKPARYAEKYSGGI